jgi:hypothetical protein
MGGVKVTVVVRWIPDLSVRCGTRVARSARLNAARACPGRAPAHAVGKVGEATSYRVGKPLRACGSILPLGRVRSILNTPWECEPQSFLLGINTLLKLCRSGG